jgi:putative serine protease PepD
MSNEHFGDDRYVHRYPGGAPEQSPTAPAGTFYDPYSGPRPGDTQVIDTPPAHRSRRGGAAMIVSAALVAGALAGLGGAAGYDALDDDARSTTVIERNTLPSTAQSEVKVTDGSVESVAGKLLPSVVQINVASAAGGGNGTGIIMSTDGEILTNNHVVEVAAEGGSITVLLPDGSTADAAIVGRDPATDVAVIKAENVSGLTPADFGSSDDLSIGEEVVAIGSPFGLENTVTSGIVSALNRPVSSSNGPGGDSSVFPAVQTDAAINPGNSGGPLVDMSGNVIGINSAIQTASDSTSQGGSIGLGFAIPIDLARAIAGQILDGEKPTHAKIGVSVSDNLAGDQITGTGARVEEVLPDSAGEEAGLEVGDVVIAIDGQRVTSSDGLVALIRSYRPGTEVTLTYLREDDEPQEARVVLDSDGGEMQP